MKLFEQIIDWTKAAEDQKTIEQNRTVKPVDNNTKHNNTIVPDDTKKEPEDKKTDLENNIARSKRISVNAQYQWKLISNAIKFIEQVSNFHFGISSVYTAIKKYIVPTSNSEAAAYSAAYVDMIIRLMYGDLRYLVKRYPKQVKYFITRNQSTGTSIAYLKGIAINPALKMSYQSLTGILYTNGEQLGLNDDTAEAKASRNLLSLVYAPKFKFIDGVKPKLRLRYTAKQVEDRIAYAYENKIWGEPYGKRINTPKPKKTGVAGVGQAAKDAAIELQQQ